MGSLRHDATRDNAPQFLGKFPSHMSVRPYKNTGACLSPAEFIMTVLRLVL